MSTLERAIEIASQAHAGRVDKAGVPYILHPLHVVLRVRELTEQIAAVLHDVVEDSDWTLDRLRTEGFSEDVLRAVDALTWRELDGESYEEFVKRTALDPVARRLKLADLEDNLGSQSIAEPTPKDHARLERYRRAKELLESPS